MNNDGKRWKEFLKEVGNTLKKRTQNFKQRESNRRKKYKNRKWTVKYD